MAAPTIPSKLPPGDLVWANLIPLLGRASAALARFDGMLTLTVQPRMARLLSTPLLIREATLSSRIEGTQVSASDVLLSEAGEELTSLSARRDVEEILAYRNALAEAEDLLTRALSA